jgi:hypothetical protein
MSAFRLLVNSHIATGAVGLLLFWVAVLSRKGGTVHRDWGRVFAYSMLITGTFAVGMGSFTVSDPLGTHPKLPDTVMVSGIFGWMMMYLGILTISLAWHGLQTVRNKRQHERNRAWFDTALQVLVIAAAVNTMARGYLIGQPLMMGISIVGMASGITNLRYSYSASPPRYSYLLEHVKALVGAGISVYTAFMTFGLVRLMPEHALNPMTWAIPLTIGLGLIIYHQYQIRKKHAPRIVAALAAPAGGAVVLEPS